MAETAVTTPSAPSSSAAEDVLQNVGKRIQECLADVPEAKRARVEAVTVQRLVAFNEQKKVCQEVDVALIVARELGNEEADEEWLRLYAHNVAAQFQPQQEIAADKFVEFLVAKDVDGALAQLKRMIAADVGNEEGTYIAPRRVQTTWRKAEWGKKLDEAFSNLFIEEDVRSPRVCLLHAGSGTGKTHALLAAASAWQEHIHSEQRAAEVTQIYVTYMNQQLAVDRAGWTLELAICIRLILRLYACSNAQCVPILQALAKRYRPDLAGALKELVARAITATRKSHVLIAVDECGLLTGSTALIVAATLGRIALMLKEKKMTCLVIMTALTVEPFACLSSREIYPLSYDLPDEDAQNTVMNDVFTSTQIEDRSKAVVRAWGGYHFRSLVCTCLLVKKFAGEVALSHVLADTRQRFEAEITPQDREELRKYVQECLSHGVHTALAKRKEALKYLSRQEAVPPVLVAFVYDSQHNYAELKHPAQRIFESSYFEDAEKQLELCGMYFDQFRALCGLPVVPRFMDVANSGDLGLAWYRALRFPEATARESNVSGVDFFTTINKDVVRTDAQPRPGTYYHPAAKSHPWVDRLCIAQNGAEECLVLYQDKINNHLPHAVASLNSAADCFVAEGWKVLCVVHVLDGASTQTTAQNSFKHPYMLVNGSCLETFYTPTFSPAVHFLKGRHSIASGSSGG